MFLLLFLFWFMLFKSKIFVQLYPDPIGMSIWSFNWINTEQLNYSEARNWVAEPYQTIFALSSRIDNHQVHFPRARRTICWRGFFKFNHERGPPGHYVPLNFLTDVSIFRAGIWSSMTWVWAKWVVRGFHWTVGVDERYTRNSIYRCFVRGPQVGNGGTIVLRFDAKIFMVLNK